MSGDVRGATLVGVPNPPGRFLARPRLVHALEEMRESRLIVVRGPGGSGKSSLVADWLRGQCGGIEDVVWLSLDPSSGSRVGFWHRVFRVLRQAGVVAEEVGPAPGDGSAEAAERLLPLVVDDLAHATPVRLVVDDFHHADPEVGDDLAWVLERAPRLRAVVVTRRRERFKHPAVAERIEIGVLAADQLAFTPAEAAEVAGLTGPEDAAKATALFVATHGHPLAVRLAARALRTGDIEAEPSAIRDVVSGFMTREFFPVFDDPATRDAAIRLSVAPYVDLDLARSLTGRDDVDAILRVFERDGIMTTREVAGVSRATFHPLVAAALSSALTELPAGEVRAARLTTSAYLEELGDPIGALRQLLDAECYDHVWPLVTRAYSEYWSYFSTEFVANVLTVPLATIRRHPTLVVGLASVGLRLEPTPSTQTRALLEEALPRLHQMLERASGGERFLLAAAILGVHRIAARYAEASDAAATLLAMIDRMPPDAIEENLSSIDTIMIQIALTGVLSGRLDDALAAARRVSTTVHLGRALHALSIIDFVTAYQGFAFEAGRIGNRVVELGAPYEWQGEVGMVGWHIGEAVTRLDRFDARDALGAIEDLDPADDYAGLWPYAVWVRNLARLLGGDVLTGAQSFLDQLTVNRRRLGGELALDLVAASGADLLIAAGLFPEARKVLTRSSSTTPPLQLSRARLGLADNDSRRVLQLIGGARGDQRWTARQRIEAGLLAAVARSRLGLRVEARADVDLSLSEVRRTGAAMGLAFAPHDDLLTLGLPDHDVRLITSAPDPFGDALSTVTLTPRERDVLAALASEQGLESIAGTMFVSVNTIKTQVRGLYRKLGVTSRGDAVTVARRRGLLES